MSRAVLVTELVTICPEVSRDSGVEQSRMSS